MTTTAAARPPEELETLFADAFVLRDPAAAAELFEDDALFVMAGASSEARGAAEIASVATQMWAHDHTYFADPRQVLQARGMASLGPPPAPGIMRPDRSRAKGIGGARRGRKRCGEPRSTLLQAPVLTRPKYRVHVQGAPVASHDRPRHAAAQPEQSPRRGLTDNTGI
jgi:hypothetical protein